MLLPATEADDETADDGDAAASRSTGGVVARSEPAPTPPAWVLGRGSRPAVAREAAAGTSPRMDPHPDAAHGHPLAERRRADKIAREIRGAGADLVGAHLRLVADPAETDPSDPAGTPEAGRSPLTGGPTLSPLADGAKAGGRLDSQGRLTCTKLLKGLGWEPHVELATYVRRDRPLLLVRRPASAATDVDGPRGMTPNYRASSRV